MQGQALFIFFAFVAAIALIGLVAWLVRRFAGNRLGANTQRGRMPRLAVIDAAAVDGRRRLVLVRRDNVEHLLMIGGPSDIVVEPNIVRAVAGREQIPSRAPVATEPPPPRVAPLPDTAFAEAEDAFPPEPLPELPPPARPTRPAFAEEMRRAPPPPVPMPDRRPEPITGFAPEPMPARPEPRMEARLESRGEPRAEPRPEPPPRLPRGEPLMPRQSRQSDPAKAPPMPMRPPQRAVAPPPPPPAPPAPPQPPAANADQNLAEMAQRLEAALRRPGGGPTEAPPVAPEPPSARAEPPPPPPAAPAKTSFENLEDEMASLLGRPKSS